MKGYQNSIVIGFSDFDNQPGNYLFICSQCEKPGPYTRVIDFAPVGETLLSDVEIGHLVREAIGEDSVDLRRLTEWVKNPTAAARILVQTKHSEPICHDCEKTLTQLPTPPPAPRARRKKRCRHRMKRKLDFE